MTKMSRKVAKYLIKLPKVYDDLVELPSKGVRFRWNKHNNVPLKDKRRVRRIFNKLNLNETLEKAYRDLIVFGSVKIPLN